MTDPSEPFGNWESLRVWVEHQYPGLVQSFGELQQLLRFTLDPFVPGGERENVGVMHLQQRDDLPIWVFIGIRVCSANELDPTEALALWLDLAVGTPVIARSRANTALPGGHVLHSQKLPLSVITPALFLETMDALSYGVKKIRHRTSKPDAEVFRFLAE